MGRSNERGGAPKALAAKKSGSHRIPRVEREIRDIIGTYLIGGFRGELPGIVQITRVMLSGDLRQAKVAVTLLGMNESDGRTDRERKAMKKTTVQELQAHAHEIQHQVNRRLQMKSSPRLTFVYDEGFEHALKVENILRDLEKNRDHTKAPQAEIDGDVIENDEQKTKKD